MSEPRTDAPLPDGSPFGEQQGELWPQVPVTSAIGYGPLVTDVRAFLQAYDEQLRTDAETPSAIASTRLGPLRLVRFAGGRGFVTYPAPCGDDAEAITSLVGAALDHYVQEPEITRVEWKMRGHDHIDGLHQALLENGFEPDEPESIMVGRAELLDVEVSLPSGVRLRTVTDDADVRAMTVMEDLAFESDMADAMTEALMRRLALNDGMQLWVAETDEQVVAAGRLEPVAGSDFAGIWGGATLPVWRRRGIYRALTAARARSALAKGKTLIHSDSNADSRPILERAGLHKVSTSTPYHWQR
jgi:ribosomal protein S18 acetylase RimI-like enzyme